jgi:endonuclease/exonuclease/phosphatase family metal-dependent hydrolase
MVRLLLFSLLLIVTSCCHAQDAEGLRIAFYNVENLFDTDDDSLTQDEEFLPWGIRGWTPTRFWAKAGNIARVLAVLDFPALVGLAEVENAACLSKLTRTSPLKTAGYSFVQYESPDARGVDVGLLYNPYLFTPVYHTPLRISFPENPEKKTRDVLYVRGFLYGFDTLHVYVCHFPSRLGGEKATEALRCHVASRIRAHIDSVLLRSPAAKVVVMGDFNDYPDSKSLRLLVKGTKGGAISGRMVNLMDNARVGQKGSTAKGSNGKSAAVKGTHKYQADWSYLDQFVVSDSLDALISIVRVCNNSFLLEPDKRWLGEKPFRTYNGMVWQGGYSDHLPIVMELRSSQP